MQAVMNDLIDIVCLDTLFFTYANEQTELILAPVLSANIYVMRAINIVKVN